MAHAAAERVLGSSYWDDHQKEEPKTRALPKESSETLQGRDFRATRSVARGSSTWSQLCLSIFCTSPISPLALYDTAPNPPARPAKLLRAPRRGLGWKGQRCRHTEASSDRLRWFSAGERCFGHQTLRLSRAAAPGCKPVGSVGLFRLSEPRWTFPCAVLSTRW